MSIHSHGFRGQHLHEPRRETAEHAAAFGRGVKVSGIGRFSLSKWNLSVTTVSVNERFTLNDDGRTFFSYVCIAQQGGQVSSTGIYLVQKD